MSKDQPSVAGSIQYSRDLYHRIKHVVIRFQESKDLYESDEFKHVKTLYLRVAQKIVKFKEDLFEKWCAEVNESVDTLLKEPILARHYSTSVTIAPQQRMMPRIRNTKMTQNKNSMTQSMGASQSRIVSQMNQSMNSSTGCQCQK